MAMSRSLLAATAAACLTAGEASGRAGAAANPIRKVVTMLEAIKAKVEAEGESEEKLYNKYMCYCKNSGGDLAKSIADAEAKAPQVSSAIEEGEAKKQQLDEDLVKHKADRDAAKGAMAEASAIREKEASAYAAAKADSSANLAAIEKAVAALEKGMGGSFLQSRAADELRTLVQSRESLSDYERQEVAAFLSAEHGSTYSPSSGEVTGILKQLGDDMGKDLSDATAAEEAAVKSHNDLMAAKTKEVAALTASIEDKTVRVGELAVSIVNMKNDLSDTQQALLEDKKFKADLEKNCDTKSAEWDQVVKTRSEELVALAETIKLLQDDDALELFKKALPSSAASFVQVEVTAASARARALAAIRAAQRRPGEAKLNFIALALQGKKNGFAKVLAMVDEMVAVLKTEQDDDDQKKVYCGAEFDSTDDKKKDLERSIADSESEIAAAEESIATVSSDIKALVEGIKELDRMVAEATEQRKNENEDFKALMAQDSAAKELIGIAKNRLNKFYNPKLYLPPPKRELSEEDRIVTNFGGTAAPTPAPGGIAGTGVTVLAQIAAHGQTSEAPPPPPESFGAFSKKSEETSGVIAMMDLLIKDLDKEMTVAQTDEKNAQADYEQMMKDSAEKRELDSKTLAEKESAKADAEASLQTHKGAKRSTSKELLGLVETIAALHSDCDWLLQNFDARKEARAGEVDALKNAKAVLSGADYSLLQESARSLRGRQVRA